MLVSVARIAIPSYIKLPMMICRCISLEVLKCLDLKKEQCFREGIIFLKKILERADYKVFICIHTICIFTLQYTVRICNTYIGPVNMSFTCL